LLSSEAPREATDGEGRVEQSNSIQSVGNIGTIRTAPRATDRPGQGNEQDRPSTVRCASTEPANRDDPITTHTPARSLRPAPPNEPLPARARGTRANGGIGQCRSSTARHVILEKAAAMHPGHGVEEGIGRATAAMHPGHGVDDRMRGRQQRATNPPSSPRRARPSNASLSSNGTHKPLQRIVVGRHGHRIARERVIRMSNAFTPAHHTNTPVTHGLIKQREAAAFATHHGWEAWPSHCPLECNFNERVMGRSPQAATYDRVRVGAQ